MSKVKFMKYQEKVKIGIGLYYSYIENLIQLYVYIHFWLNNRCLAVSRKVIIEIKHQTYLI